MTATRAPRTLSYEEARRFYDRFGTKQDKQAFYEQSAIDRLCAHADFGSATAVLELGCGTGKLAERMLGHELGPEARYLGLDVSGTMVALARDRTVRFGARAEIRQTDGSPGIDVPSGSFDRFVSCYVLDLLSPGDIQAVFGEAARILPPGALLCTAGLTDGTTPVARLVSRSWAWLQARRPAWVGGCRPIAVRELLPRGVWRVEYAGVVSAFGVPSEVVIAARRG